MVDPKKPTIKILGTILSSGGNVHETVELDGRPMTREMAEVTLEGRDAVATWWPTGVQLLGIADSLADNAYNNMEGADGVEWARWERMFCAWADIADDIRKELAAKRKQEKHE
jgi:hypothetical protein